MTLPDPDLAQLVARAERALRENVDTRSIVELAHFVKAHPEREIEAERIWAELLRSRPKVE